MKRKIKALVEKFGGELISSDLCTTYLFKTCVGDLQVTFYENDYTFIPMMFRENFDLKKFLELSNDDSINKHSFKWNIHGSDKTFNFQRLERRLEFLSESNKTI